MGFHGLTNSNLNPTWNKKTEFPSTAIIYTIFKLSVVQKRLYLLYENDYIFI